MKNSIYEHLDALAEESIDIGKFSSFIIKFYLKIVFSMKILLIAFFLAVLTLNKENSEF